MACRSRSSRFGVAAFAAFLLAPAAADAAELPPIRSSETNRVADCATPGRLTLYVKQRNPKLDARYEGLAGEYMRNGEELHVRWDYAFFQMLLETGYLTYGGDVKPDQNNFAGLGATGKGAHGESFKDISTGARAHIEHLVMYSGERVENPVAERTRNIQEWGVLTDWQKSVDGPITFSQLATKWAPGSRKYGSDIAAIAERFFDGVCKEPDPDGAVVAAADEIPKPPRKSDVSATADALPKAGTTSKADAASKSKAKKVETAATFETATADTDTLPSKGAAAVAAAASEAKTKAKPPAQTAATSPPVTLLNPEEATAADAPVEPAAASAAEAAAAAQSGKSVEVAALPGAIGAGSSDKKPEKQKSEKKPDKKKDAASGKCRVWTASYGGSKAIIIKAVSDKTVNYTVLDVNEGAEKREADAYINAYAKGGQSVGEFQTQTQALEKAFELCPEG